MDDFLYGEPQLAVNVASAVAPPDAGPGPAQRWPSCPGCSASGPTASQHSRGPSPREAAVQPIGQGVAWPVRANRAERARSGPPASAAGRTPAARLTESRVALHDGSVETRGDRGANSRLHPPKAALDGSSRGPRGDVRPSYAPDRLDGDRRSGPDLLREYNHGCGHRRRSRHQRRHPRPASNRARLLRLPPHLRAGRPRRAARRSTSRPELFTSPRIQVHQVSPAMRPERGAWGHLRRLLWVQTGLWARCEARTPASC